MRATGTSTRRVIGVITLMVLAAWALRGYVPGVERAVEEVEPRSSNPLALAAVIALLCAAVAIIGFAIVVRMRDKRPRPTPMGDLPRSDRSGERPPWRFALVALAALIALVFLVALLSRLAMPVPTDTAPPTATPDEVAGGPVDPRPPVEDDGSDSDVVNYLIPPMLLLMALIVVGTAVASRRQVPRPAPAVFEETDSPAVVPTTTTSLARAAEVGLAEIGDLSREPREAIIACYAAMERELTRVPGAVPQACDTPTEVLARAVASGALRADSATELVELFEEARFSPHVMSEKHRDAAVQVLNRVLTELPQRTAEAAS